MRLDEWVYGYYVQTKVPILGLGHYIIVNNKDACQIDINTLCVFTNRLDKNKKEIYEGDKLLGKRCNKEHTQIVEFNNNMDDLCLLLNGFLFEFDYYVPGDCMDAVVSGDIYD
jgi:hypothetical protein